jgi:hypothetical protein
MVLFLLSTATNPNPFISPDTMQALGQIEEVAFKGTLVVLTLGTCVRFAVVQYLDTKREIQRERRKGDTE